MKKVDNLLEKISDKSAVIGVIGLGYVGLPLAVAAAEKGYDVIGFDIDKEKIKKLTNRENYIKDIDDMILKEVIDNKKFRAVSKKCYLVNADIIVVCVPTPLNRKRKPDLSYMCSAAKIIKAVLRQEQLIIIESTTYPGTTEDVFKKILEETKLKAGKDFYLAFSPERIDPANAVYNVKNTPKIVGGYDSDSALATQKFYQSILNADVKVVSDLKTAEMTKILENSYRLVNIALIFEIAKACKKLRINVWEVIEAAKTKPYGFQAFYPGPGVGGHCIPIDPLYLTWRMRELGQEMPLIEKASIITEDMPKYIVKKSKRYLKRKHKHLKNSNVLLVGMSYKKDISDLRESPSLKILEHLEKKHAKVSYFDPYVPNFNHKNKLYESIQLDEVDKYDLVIICVNHSNIDYRYIYYNAKMIFDLKNVYGNFVEGNKVYSL